MPISNSIPILVILCFGWNVVIWFHFPLSKGPAVGTSSKVGQNPNKSTNKSTINHLKGR